MSESETDITSSAPRRREPEVPFGVLTPGMFLQELVVRVRARLCVPPVAVQDVLASVDESRARTTASWLTE
jgi:hypothetical protein